MWFLAPEGSPSPCARPPPSAEPVILSITHTCKRGRAPGCSSPVETRQDYKKYLDHKSTIFQLTWPHTPLSGTPIIGPLIDLLPARTWLPYFTPPFGVAFKQRFSFLGLAPGSASAVSSLHNPSTHLQASYCTQGPWKPDDLRRNNCHSFFLIHLKVQGGSE